MLVAGSGLRFLAFRGSEQEHHSTWSGGVWQKRGARGQIPQRLIYGSHENNTCAPAVMCTDGPVIPLTQLLASSLPGEHAGAVGPVLGRKSLKVCVHLCTHACKRPMCESVNLHAPALIPALALSVRSYLAQRCVLPT